MMTDMVIYHANCSDGLTAAWAAWTVLKDSAVYVPCSHGCVPPDVTGKHVVVVDFSFPRPILENMAEKAASLNILDHHKSAQDALAGFPGVVFDLDKSGAVLSWEYFHPGTSVPLNVLYVQDRDLWRWELPGSREFYAALELVPRTLEDWDRAMSTPAAKMVQDGEILLQYKNHLVGIIATRARRATLFGRNLWVVNSSIFRNELGERLFVHDGIALVWYCAEDGNVRGSLRAQQGVNILDLATKLGGGGHPTAAGFVYAGNIDDLLVYV